MFEKILSFTRKRHVAGLKCAFTGHRPQNLPFRFNETDERCLRLKAELRKLIVQMIEQKNVTHFISVALGPLGSLGFTWDRTFKGDEWKL